MSRSLRLNRPATPAVPDYDADHRELRWRGQLVKRFGQPAPNQEAILIAFQRAGWQRAIDDPLPADPDVDPRDRLHDAIKNLNKQKPRQVLRFRGNGSGRRVLWEPIDGQ